MTEELIVRHCSPTLAGLKTGNLFTCKFETKEKMCNSLREINKKLGVKGIRVIPMRYIGDVALVYLYRPYKLKKDLENHYASDLLKKHGYRIEYPERCIAKISSKLKVGSEFPHEIGLFLGYPPEDVKGFIENKAECSKCVGCWKVYGDVDNAKTVFEKYKKCTENYLKQLANGKSVEQLTIAV